MLHRDIYSGYMCLYPYNRSHARTACQCASFSLKCDPFLDNLRLLFTMWRLRVDSLDEDADADNHHTDSDSEVDLPKSRNSKVRLDSEVMFRSVVASIEKALQSTAAKVEAGSSNLEAGQPDLSRRFRLSCASCHQKLSMG